MSDEAPIFGENGAILNKDTMQPQSEWQKSAPKGMTRKQILALTFTMGIIVLANLANMIWKFF